MLTKLIVVVLTVLLFSNKCLCWWWNDKIRLMDIKELEFYSGKMTTGRRSSVPQLKCVGGSVGCDSLVFYKAKCYNVGTNDVDVHWQCFAELDEKVKFGRIEVHCEGYDFPNDPYILEGSCGLEYTLDYVGGSWSTTTDVIFCVIWISLAIALVFSIRQMCTSEDKSQTQQQPRVSPQNVDNSQDSSYQSNLDRPPQNPNPSAPPPKNIGVVGYPVTVIQGNNSNYPIYPNNTCYDPRGANNPSNVNNNSSNPPQSTIVIVRKKSNDFLKALIAGRLISSSMNRRGNFCSNRGSIDIPTPTRMPRRTFGYGGTKRR